PRAVAACERARRGVADMANAERIDEAFERNVTPAADRTEEIAHRGLAVALDFLQRELLPVTRLQRENIRGLLDPAFLEEIVDLLRAEPIDVERAARDEQLQMLGLLERTRELAGAAEAHALRARRIDLAHHRRLERTRAFLWEFVFLRALRPL